MIQWGYISFFNPLNSRNSVEKALCHKLIAILAYGDKKRKKPWGKKAT